VLADALLRLTGGKMFGLFRFAARTFGARTGGQSCVSSIMSVNHLKSACRLNTRMRVSAVNGGATLLFDMVRPGCGAPTHLHAVEEV